MSDGGRERVVTPQGVCNLPLAAPNQGAALSRAADIET
jgi:hypothetical protein